MKKQPNILVICSDQHHPLMSSYRGHKIVKTPNLDRLAKRGTHFTRAYCNSPICTPSRMSFITGKYVHQIDNWMIGVPLDPNEMTWPKRLESAGIPSTMFGKMDFCGEYQDGGFSDYKILRKRPAFKSVPLKKPFLPRLNDFFREDKRRHLIVAGTRTEEIMSDGGECIGELNDKIGNYDHDRIITNFALDYLKNKEAEGSGRPWALYIGLIQPHWPFRVPDKYFNMYYPDNIELPFDAHFPNERLHPALRNFQKGLDLGKVTDEILRKVIAVYYGMITCMDDMVGEILNELEKQDMLDDTYIIYTSDHGESLGEHGLFYKQCSYEGSVGIPLIISGPGIPSSKRIDRPVSLIDMYPTIMDMAGLKTEEDRPGSSWLHLVKGENHKRDDYVFSEFHANFFKHSWYMLVKDDFKYTYYVNDRPSLYNLKKDPHEMDDLASNKEYKDILNEFKSVLLKILDPEKVDRQAKKDLGLIGPDGEDYTLTKTFKDFKHSIHSYYKRTING